MNISDYAYKYQGWDLSFLPISPDDAAELREAIEQDSNLDAAQREALDLELDEITGDDEW